MSVCPESFTEQEGRRAARVLVSITWIRQTPAPACNFPCVESASPFARLHNHCIFRKDFVGAAKSALLHTRQLCAWLSPKEVQWFECGEIGMAVVATAAAQEDAFYAKIISLRDAVLAGTHPTFRLPESSIQELKASLAAAQPNGLGAQDSVVNGVGAAHASASTPNANPLASVPAPYAGLPGLFSTPSANGQQSLAQQKPAGLDPIFLQKSDSLVREERRLKRQRLEHALDESDKRAGYTVRDKEAYADSTSNVDVDCAMVLAQERVKPMSGLRPDLGGAKAAGSNAGSFDENDYYSSQVESDWSSEKGSDAGAGGFTEEQPLSKSFGKRPVPAGDALRLQADVYHPAQTRSQVDSTQLYGTFEEADADDEDEEYSPPEPAAFDSFREEDITMQDTMLDDAEDDDEYEPGEITQESAMPTPQYGKSTAQASPNVPVPTFHNRLTHIAAPQPNRVSPLAMQKGPNIELELVNGRPEIVNKPQKSSKRTQQQQASRVSSASPSGPGNGGPISKKEGKKAKLKRKRENREERRSKRQERQNAQSPPSPAHRDPYIKPEPVSPPPFSNVPEVNAYGHRYAPQTAPIEIDLDSPRYPPQPQYAYAPAPRYEYAPRIASPQVVRVSSAAGYRPMQRDTQDLRRVASLHHAQRPASPPQAMYSPAAPYQGVQAYGQTRQMSVAPAPDPGYPEGAVRYVTAERQPEPLRLQEYRESSPTMMPPPSAPPPRRIVVDQYGNRYYAAEAAPPPRASMAPPGRGPEAGGIYERAASRMSVAPQQAAPSAYYEQTMPPPPPPVRRQAPQDQPVEYLDSNGYRVREYSTRPAEPARYSVAPTSPTYQSQSQYDMMPPPPPPSARQAPPEVRYEQMPPPPAPQPPQQPTSPVYAPPPRAYSVRPDGYEVPNAYAARQQSVAPIQYIRQDAPPQAPVRATSVVPGSEFGGQAYQQRAPSYAPQPTVKYVDEYGREIMPQEVRQVSQYRY